jgi:hypothetical protein
MATKSKKPRERKPRQQMIPGSEPELIQEIEDAAESCVEARKELKEAKSENDAAFDCLIGLMKKHRKTIYASERLTVIIKGSTKATVRKNPEKDIEPDAGDAEPSGPRLATNGEAKE